ncbi:MAG: hypothetical protein M3O23_11045 [Actinomycetota bacterium]|nr:hypothetical protein [Actinomycetota bacterium]
MGATSTRGGTLRLLGVSGIGEVLGLLLAGAGNGIGRRRARLVGSDRRLREDTASVGVDRGRGGGFLGRVVLSFQPARRGDGLGGAVPLADHVTLHPAGGGLVSLSGVGVPSWRRRGLGVFVGRVEGALRRSLLARSRSNAGEGDVTAGRRRLRTVLVDRWCVSELPLASSTLLRGEIVLLGGGLPASGGLGETTSLPGAGTGWLGGGVRHPGSEAVTADAAVALADVTGAGVGGG